MNIRVELCRSVRLAVSIVGCYSRKIVTLLLGIKSGSHGNNGARNLQLYCPLLLLRRIIMRSTIKSYTVSYLSGILVSLLLLLLFSSH